MNLPDSKGNINDCEHLMYFFFFSSPSVDIDDDTERS